MSSLKDIILGEALVCVEGAGMPILGLPPDQLAITVLLIMLRLAIFSIFVVQRRVEIFVLRVGYEADVLVRLRAVPHGEPEAPALAPGVGLAVALLLVIREHVGPARKEATSAWCKKILAWLNFPPPPPLT